MTVLKCGLHPSTIQAQEVITSVNDRVEADGQFTPDVSDDSVRRGGWDLGAVISAAYDDNIYLSPDNAQSDIVLRVAPSVGYSKGDSTQSDSGAFVKFAYQPTAVVYLEGRGDNRVDQDFAVSAGWRGKATRVIYEGAFRQLGNATADVGKQTDRVEYGNIARVAWTPREKLELELAIGQSKVDYDDPEFLDSRKTYAEAALRYAYSPKTKIGVIYQVGRFEVDGSETQNTHQITGSIDWKPREKIRVLLESGIELRKVSGRSDTNPVLNGRIEWMPREGTSLYVTAYQREEASAFFSGQNYRQRGATLGISQRIGRKWTARFEAGRENLSYKQVSGTGTAGREDRIWFVRPAVEYRLNDKTRIECFFQVNDNSSNDDAFGYKQNLFGVQLYHQF